MRMSKIIGIDLGTTNSLISHIKENRPVIIPVDNKRYLPSIVGVDENGDIIVGSKAVNQMAAFPDRTVKSIKRLMGTKVVTLLGNKSFLPEEISGHILQYLKEAAEKELHEKINRCVITVPAYFTDSQKQATIRAGELAGLDVERIINEPTSAALSYGFFQETDKTVLVYDLGGGTFDVSVVEINQGVIEVLANCGDTKIGGDDFDEQILKIVADDFMDKNNVDIRKDSKAVHRALFASIQAKESLSNEYESIIKEAFIMQDSKGSPLHLNYEIDRSHFEELINSKIDQTMSLCEKVIKEAQIENKEIDHLLLVGGSSKIPIIKNRLEGLLDIKAFSYMEPQENVVLGAAIQGAIIEGNKQIDTALVDVCPHTLGIEALDISPNGIPVLDRYVPIISKNTVIPTVKEEAFSTVYPGQNKIKVKVYQGEHEVASKNELIDEIGLTFDADEEDISGILVKFEYDINGVVTIHVKDKKTKTVKLSSVDSSKNKVEPQKKESESPDSESQFEKEVDSEFDRLLEKLKEASAKKDNSLFDSDIQKLIEKAQMSVTSEEKLNIKDEIAELLYEIEE